MADDTADVNESFPLRYGGRVDLTDEALLVVGDENVRVRLADVEEVTVEPFDWFLAVMSVALVGFGGLTLDGMVLAGAAFVAVGVASLYWTYRKRGKVRIKVVGRPKPISVFPVDTDALHDALEPALAGDGGSASDETG